MVQMAVIDNHNDDNDSHVYATSKIRNFTHRISAYIIIIATSNPAASPELMKFPSITSAS
jgi:hypothetical protein